MCRSAIVLFVLVGMLAAGNTVRADLVGYWPVNEGSGNQLIDRSGQGHTGTIAGAAWTAPGWNGQGVCLEFDGADDSVEIDDAADLKFDNASAYTLTAWVNVTVLPGHWSGVVTKGRDTGNWYGIWINASNAWVFGHEPNNQVGSPVVAGLWTHVAMVYDNGSKKIYLDGQLDNEATASASGDNAGKLVFGAALGVTEFTPIQINEVRIYNHALTEEEIAGVMEGPTAPELATEPVPSDQALDVPRDTDLSWRAGDFAMTHDVYFGAVFEDVNEATRTNDLGVLLSQGQSAWTYDLPGVLDFGQTYYWRIDEVNGAPDSTIFKGDVWSFLAEPFAYAIKNVVATSNTTWALGQGPENTVNDSGLNADDQHSTETDTMWSGTPNPDEPSYIQFEFDRLYKLHEMLVWNCNMDFEMFLGLGVKDTTIEYSEDGTAWTTLGDFVLNQGPGTSTYTYNTTVPFEGVAAKAVRLNINSSWGAAAQLHGLSEARFMYIPAQAREPEPNDGAVDVAIDSMLSWRSGREATSHEIYLGTDPNALSLGATTSQNSYDPGVLDLDTTTYWQVVEVNNAEAIPAWASDIWSFSTQEYIEIEGFESYDDDIDAGTTIWQTWIDGIDDPTNGGSQVGHNQSPFAELTTVHGGAQSMPLSFDNGSASAFSETDRTFSPAQDWTQGAVKSLSLWFHGTPSNTGQLYVAINGTKVLYDGEATDMAGNQWQPWNIDLSFAQSLLQNVTVLTIGVEGTGSGLVFIDDIRLYAKTPPYITPVEPDTANLVAYYALDGNAQDSSGYGNHGTEMGGFTYVAAVNGQGLDLDGAVNSSVDLGNPPQWPSGRSPRSMSAWGMSRTIQDGWRWMAAYGTAATGQAMFLGMNGASFYGGGWGDDIFVSGFWVEDEWYHTCLTYDGTTARLYGNGIEVTSGQKDWNLVLSRAHLGQQVSDQDEFWNGIIDEVRIYDVVLTPEEIAGLAGRTKPVHVPF